MYGNSLPTSVYDPRRSVIGEVTKSAAGNIVLRVGQTWADDVERGWQQTEHVVLRPSEAGKFVNEIVALLKKKYDRTVAFSFNRELAASLVRAINGEILDDETVASLGPLREKLIDFANSEEPS